MLPDASPIVPLEQVPAQLAALKREKFPWFRTPVLDKTSTDMRALCLSVMAAWEKDSNSLPSPDAIRAHRAVFAETTYTLLKEGVFCMAGILKPSEVIAKTAGRLDEALRRRGELDLDKHHPFEADPAVVRRVQTKEKSKWTNTMVTKSRTMLCLQPGYEEAAQWLKNGGHIQQFMETNLRQLLSPDATTVRSLPTELRGVLNSADGDEASKRSMLVNAVVDYCRFRNPSVGQAVEVAVQRYLAKEFQNVGSEGTPDDEYMILLIKSLLQHASRSQNAEADLRPAIMGWIMAIANEGQGTMRSNGSQFKVEQILQHVALQEWPKIFDHYRLHPTPAEGELAAMAAISRCYSLEEVRKTVESIERQ